MSTVPTGLTLDPILLFLRRLTSPVLLLPALAALQHPSAPAWSRALHYLTCLGVFYRVNAWLSKGTQNNWTKDDSWDWDKEVIVVTGGSAGIGKQVVLWLSRELGERRRRKEEGKGKGKEKEKETETDGENGPTGGMIVVLDVLPLDYDAPDNVMYIHTDVRVPSSIHSAAERMRSTVGHPTVVINNAGVCRGKHILSAAPSELDFVFAVNTLAHWYMAQEFLPHMVATNHGHVVTVASVGAYVQAPRMVDYNASKAAALSFHEGLGMELRTVYDAKKVRTTLIAPSYVATKLFDGYTNRSKFLFPALRPETVAEEIGKAVMSTQSCHIVLPRAFYAFTGLRGWVSWLHLRVLTGANDVMVHWRGRQVISIEEGRETTEGVNV